MTTNEGMPSTSNILELVLALVADRDGLPRHLAVVGLEGALVAVRRDEDDLEPLGLEVLLVRGHERRREALARRAPVGTEVEADVLGLLAQLGDLDRLALRAVEHLVAERLPDRRRLPRKVDA